MFKNFQTYVTPILLSYVDKYIKDFKADDLQVSLWSGSVSLYNLELRPDTIQHELNLPFSLSSGHIHELIIQVPWMKIAYEPIVITINTIECILKLMDGPHQQPLNVPTINQNKEDIDAPPGYVQSLVNRIVNNIAFRCNNVILKYVEEDIVVSVNIKQFYLDNVDGNWIPKFTEITPEDLHIRKLINLSDLTLCLDKRNAAGKIETYLEPLLYKCEIEFKLDSEYAGMLNKKPNHTRIHINSPKLEFNFSYQQIPMIMRIASLFLALKKNQLDKFEAGDLTNDSRHSASKSSNPLSYENSNMQDSSDYSASWSGWIWSFVDPFPLGNLEGEQDNSLNTYPVLLSSINFQTITFSFKIPDLMVDNIGTYPSIQRKIRYSNICSLELKTVICETSSHGLNRFCFRGGVHNIIFYPEHTCPCGIPDAITIQDERRKIYFESVPYINEEIKMWPIEYDSSSIVESLKPHEMLGVCPAFAMDYVYHLVIPEDKKDNFNIHDLEYSNFKEDVSINFVLGPSNIFLCSGMIHRLSLLITAADAYDYAPYFIPKPLMRKQDLHPPTTDDYDALTEHVPKVNIKMVATQPKIYISLWDHLAPVKSHSYFDGSSVSSVNRRKISPATTFDQSIQYFEKLKNMPSILVECKNINLLISKPMYPNRITYVTCQLPDPPAIMLDSCYNNHNLKVEDLRAYLVHNSNHKMKQDVTSNIYSEESFQRNEINTPIITECNFQMSSKTLFLEEFWKDNEAMLINDYNFNMENVTFCITMAKLLVVYHIMMGVFPPSQTTINSMKNDKSENFCAKEHNVLLNTSLLTDTFEDSDKIHLDVNFEGLSNRIVYLSKVYTHRIVLNSAKIFAIDFSKVFLGVDSDAKQVWVISAPETSSAVNVPFLKAVFQNSSSDTYPTFLTARLEEWSFVLDPLLCHWLTYKYIKVMHNLEPVVTDTANSVLPNVIQKRQSRRSLDEIVNRIGGSSRTLNRLSLGQSSSDREKDFVHGSLQISSQPNVDSTKEKISIPQENCPASGNANFMNNLITSYFNKDNVAIFIEMENISMFFPTSSISAVNFDSVNAAIHSAVSNNLKNDSENIAIIRLPSVLLKNSSLRYNLLSHCIYGLPVKLPLDLWNKAKSSHPWTITLKNLSCFTLSNIITQSIYTVVQTNILKPVSSEVTISFIPKLTNSKKNPIIDKEKTVLSESKNITPEKMSLDVSNKELKNSKNEPIPSGDIQQKKTEKTFSTNSSVGICIHIDTEMLTVSINYNQIVLLSALIHGIREFFNVLIVSEETPTIPLEIPKMNLHKSTSLNRMQYNSNPNDISIDNFQEEDFSKNSDQQGSSENEKLININQSESHNENIMITTWMQWTISRIVFKSYISTTDFKTKDESNKDQLLKLVFTADDVVSSLDKQHEYLKWKTKVVTAGIHYYKKIHPSDVWMPGMYCGVIMKGRENIKHSKSHTENCFLFINITKAKCASVHSKWKDMCKITPKVHIAKNDYISEIEISLQALDLIISLDSLEPFIFLISPFISHIDCDVSTGKLDIIHGDKLENSEKCTMANKWNCHNLPLCYFEGSVIRIIVPINIQQDKYSDDVVIMQVDKVSLTPTADNPVCRNSLRPDLYQEAARKGYLIIPGSELEDRQCQLVVKGLCVHTTQHTYLEKIFGSEVQQSKPTLSENPALQWNDSILKPNTLLPINNIMEKIDICLVLALAIFYRSELICGPTVDLNVVSDIEIHLSTAQLMLVNQLIYSSSKLFEKIHSFSRNSSNGDENEINYNPIKCPYHKYINERALTKSDISEHTVGRLTPTLSTDTGIASDMMSTITTISKSTPILMTKSQSFSKKNEKSSSADYFDIFITFGKVGLNLFERLISEEMNNMDSSENKKITTEPNVNFSTKAFLYITLIQPNFTFSKYHYISKSQFSIFHLSVSLGDDFIHDGIPKPNDFLMEFFETKAGIPDSHSEILPNFLTIKWEKNIVKKISMKIEIKCPIRITASLDRLQKLKKISELLMSSKIENNSKSKNESQTNFENVENDLNKNNNMKLFLDSYDFIDISTVQTVLAINAQDNIDFELLMSFSAFKHAITFYSRPEKIFNNGLIDSLTLALRKTDDRQSKILINPWTIGFEANLIWDSWQASDLVASQPIFHVFLQTDKLLIELSIEHINILNGLINYWLKNQTSIKDVLFVNENSSSTKIGKIDNNPKSVPKIASFWNNISPHDQHYKDDLRAGAFKFIHGGIGNPLPYQVFIGSRGLTWRYPQPRAITCVHSFPVPFQLINDEDIEPSLSESVLCTLEYFSDINNGFQYFAKFYIKQDQRVKLNQSTFDHRTVLSAMWRVVMHKSEDDVAHLHSTRKQLYFDKSRFLSNTCQKSNQKTPSENENYAFPIKPQALAACLRIDSYYTPHLVPKLQAVLNISLIEINLFNYYRQRPLPPLLDSLQLYQVNGFLPSSYVFCSLSSQSFNLQTNLWNKNIAMIKFESDIRCHIIDGSGMILDKVAELDDLSICHCISEEYNDVTDFTIYANAFNANFGPQHLHSLYISYQIWKDIFLSNMTLMSTVEDMPIDDMDNCYNCSNTKPDMTIPKYFICNDTNLNLRIGQHGTDEHILLESRKCHLYSWKSYESDSLLDVTINLGNWKISKPFQIETAGISVFQLSRDEVSPVSIIVIVEIVTPVQRCVTFMGRLVFVNMLSDIFDLKIYQKKVLQLHGASGTPIISIDANNRAPSLLVETNAETTIRLRFCGSSSGWTGDIPLKECLKGNMPWLVKVPSHNTLQYVSIWCRVIKDVVYGRTLVTLSPLYILKSHLPTSMPVEIKTENSTELTERLIEGRGFIHFIPCPGTTTTKHDIYIKTISSENSEKQKIPLSYEMIDQSKFFPPKEENPNIDLILKNIKIWFDNQVTCDSEWPYISPEDGIKWKPIEHQYNSDITIRYLPAVRGVDSLIVDVAPWALLGNCSGSTLTIFNSSRENLCSINHREVLIPPAIMFKEPFYCGISYDNEIFTSQPLTISTTTLGPYEKSTNGYISLDSHTCFTINCFHNLNVFDIFYEIKENINIFRISSKYTIINQLPLNINVLPVALHMKENLIQLPENVSEFITTIDSNQNNSTGIPINQFYIITTNHNSTNEEKDYGLFMYFNASSENTYSCPVRVDSYLQRKPISVPLEGGKSLPIVVTFQEYKGQVFITIFKDESPQFIIRNHADMSIATAQVLRESIISDMYRFVSKDEILPHSVVQECWKSNWHCVIKPGAETFYTLPVQSLQYPELFQPADGTSNLVENSYLTFAFIKNIETEPRAWSIPVDVSTNTLEQFVKLPGYVGDIKVIVENHCYATLITINNVTQHDISASDIRQRLLTNFNETTSEEKELEAADDNERPSTSTEVDEIIEYSQNAENAEFSQNAANIPSEIYYHGYSKNCILKKMNINLVVDVINVVLNNNNPTYENSKSVEVIYLVCDKFIVTSAPSIKGAKIVLTIGDLQIDNPLFSSGGYDFQVLLVKQGTVSSAEPCDWKSSVTSQATYVSNVIDSLRKECLFKCAIEYEIWNRDSVLNSGLSQVNISIGSISTYIEDCYISTLVDYATDFMPPNLPLICSHGCTGSVVMDKTISVPEYMIWEASAVAYPIRLGRLHIEPLNILLSVHSTMLFYLALDHSPLQFAKFERLNILTSSYRLGHALTMHYLSEAIFGAGWVVGSLEILGSPSGLARRVTAGLRDLVREPCLGLLRGPWGFVVGMTHGSVSLLKHVTQGTVESVSMVMGSVARNLDRLSLDEDHMQRTQRARRRRPRGLVTALSRGLQGLGLSFLGAIGGIAHEALIVGYEQRKGPVAVAAGLTRGLVGMITKPLSATADLLALTGQGLLQQAGWDQHPTPRWIRQLREPITFNSENFRLKLGNTFAKSSLLFLCQGIDKDTSSEITLILTNMWLLLLDTRKDKVLEMNSLEKWSIIKNNVATGDLFLSVKSEENNQSSQAASSKSETDVQMDPALRARIAAYIGLEEAQVYSHHKIYRLLIPCQHSGHCATMILFAQLHSLNRGFPLL